MPGWAYQEWLHEMPDYLCCPLRQRRAKTMTVGDTYAVLAERLGLPGSVRLRKLLEYLMSPEQSRIVV